MNALSFKRIDTSWLNLPLEENTKLKPAMFPWQAGYLTNQWQISVPGRVNLIGEHIDYYGLPVLPMAIQRHLVVDFEVSTGNSILVESDSFGVRSLKVSDSLTTGEPGDWANYLKAALLAVRQKWRVKRGFRAHVASNLPSAAGLSSSSALLTAFTLGLLRANEVTATLDELMSVLPEAEHFVGTRGGGMDHAAVLGSLAGHASQIRFNPFGIHPIRIPQDWCFLLAHSLVRAEKSGAARARYNACRTAGLAALSKYGFGSYQEALQSPRLNPTEELSRDEHNAFTHVVSEATRVSSAVACLQDNQREEFGQLLNASHASLCDRLQVSCPSLDRIAEIAVEAGANGARLTGAGFGGCAIILCAPERLDHITAALESRFYAGLSAYSREAHLFPVQASNGALNA